MVAPTIPTLPCKIQEGGIPERDQLMGSPGLLVPGDLHLVFLFPSDCLLLRKMVSKDWISCPACSLPQPPLGACLRGLFERSVYPTAPQPLTLIIYDQLWTSQVHHFQPQGLPNFQAILCLGGSMQISTSVMFLPRWDLSLYSSAECQIRGSLSFVSTV